MNKALKSNEGGFTYLEVMVAIVILTIGITAQLSALSFSMLRAKETEGRNQARQIAASTLESIFAARDLGNSNGIDSWDKINETASDPDGIFITGWRPIRDNAGIDGIHGTADDACNADIDCTVGSYTNDELPLAALSRKIEITDVTETGATLVRKKRIEVKVRYFVGQLAREETLASLIADLPFYE